MQLLTVAGDADLIGDIDRSMHQKKLRRYAVKKYSSLVFVCASSGGARNLRLGMPNIKKKLKLIHNIVDDKLHNKFIIAPFGCCCSCHRHFALPQHAVVQQ